MTRLLAAATFAALLAAAPAGAQTVYGMPTGNTGVTWYASDADWRDSIIIYATGDPDSNVLGNAIAPLGGDVGAATSGATGGVGFVVSGGGSGNTGLSGFGGGVNDATTPVPEPATWAMMLVGFGAVGGMLRSRRKATLRYA